MKIRAVTSGGDTAMISASLLLFSFQRGATTTEPSMSAASTFSVEGSARRCRANRSGVAGSAEALVLHGTLSLCRRALQRVAVAQPKSDPKWAQPAARCELPDQIWRSSTLATPEIGVFIDRRTKRGRDGRGTTRLVRLTSWTGPARRRHQRLLVHVLTATRASLGPRSGWSTA